MICVSGSVDVEGLACHSCGQISEDFSKIQGESHDWDIMEILSIIESNNWSNRTFGLEMSQQWLFFSECASNETEIIKCEPGEVCVTYRPHYTSSTGRSEEVGLVIEMFRELTKTDNVIMPYGSFGHSKTVDANHSLRLSECAGVSRILVLTLNLVILWSWFPSSCWLAESFVFWQAQTRPRATR